jgi:N-acyl-L-homoserine lactone synthetase
MKQPPVLPERLAGSPLTEFVPRTLDGEPLWLEQSHRLRYQVYCVERRFLDASQYPDHREADEFDAHSVHVGAIDTFGDLAGTARIIKPNPHGFPMFRHCVLFPDLGVLDGPGTLAVEVSRVAISRDYARRRRRTEPFMTLMKAIILAAKQEGATHLIGATDAALHRWLVHFGFPYRVSGPAVDYYGPVAPCVMSLLELDEVILGGRYPALEGIPVGPAPFLWPGQTGYAADGAGAAVINAGGCR